MNYDMKFVAIEADSTEEELHTMACQLSKLVGDEGPGFLCSISGYDEDSRELYEIPEVRPLCQRMIDSGFISVLEVCTTVKEFRSPYLEEKLGDDLTTPGFGSLEIWLLAKNKLQRLVKEQRAPDRREMEKFILDLSEANGRVKWT